MRLSASTLNPQVIEQVLNLAPVFDRHPVQAVYLFGSALENPYAAHDIDIAILPERGFSYRAFYADLSLAIGTDRLDIVDLRLAPAYLLEEILTRGRCIYLKDPIKTTLFEQGKRLWIQEVYSRWQRLSREDSMPVKPEFIEHALNELERVAQELERYQQVTAADLASNRSLRWTVERGLLVGLTLVFQVADHILVRGFQRRAETYEALLAELRNVGVISRVLYQDLRGAGGFRNVLVHEYVAIDLDEVVEALRKAPRVFRTFIEEIRHWLDHIHQEEG